MKELDCLFTHICQREDDKQVWFSCTEEDVKQERQCQC